MTWEAIAKRLIFIYTRVVKPKSVRGMMQPVGIKCSNCNKVLHEPPSLPPGQTRPQCPHCGSVLRTVLMEGTATVTAYPSLEAKKGPKRRGDYLLELFVGANWSTALGRFMQKVRRIDREHDRYEERVVDPGTGETIHSAKERLSDHWGHGSDKGRRTP
jgi:hypothetical protein